MILNTLYCYYLCIMLYCFLIHLMVHITNLQCLDIVIKVYNHINIIIVGVWWFYDGCIRFGEIGTCVEKRLNPEVSPRLI